MPQIEPGAAAVAPVTKPGAAAPATKPAAKKAPAKKSTAKSTVPSGTVGQFINAIMTEESGGDYSAVGPATSQGDHAYGKYQIMGANIPAWSKQVLGHSITVEQYLADPALQEKIAQGKLTDYYNKYGAAGAASAWFTGNPKTYLTNPGASDGNTTAQQYVNNVLSSMGQQPTSVGMTAASTGGAQASNKDIIAQVEASYGYPASYLKDKELGPILLDAAKNHPGDIDWLKGQLFQTNWWKKNSDSMRTFDAAGKLDPASQKQQISQQIDMLRQRASQLGLIVDSSHLAQMAVDSLRFSWDEHQMLGALTSEGKFDLSGKAGSAALTLRDNLKAEAKQWMVPVGDTTLMQWVKNVEAGNVSQGDFEGYLKEQAKSLNPALAGAIDRGVTVAQYTDPYKQQAAQILERTPDSIDFMNDPKFKPALNQIDPKTGDRTAMGLADWDTYLRGLPEYQQTKGANDQAAAFTSTLLNTFGKIA